MGKKTRGRGEEIDANRVIRAGTTDHVLKPLGNKFLYIGHRPVLHCF